MASGSDVKHVFPVISLPTELHAHRDGEGARRAARVGAALQPAAPGGQRSGVAVRWPAARAANAHLRPEHAGRGGQPAHQPRWARRAQNTTRYDTLKILSEYVPSTWDTSLLLLLYFLWYDTRRYGTVRFDTLKILSEYVPSTWDTFLLLLLYFLWYDTRRYGTVRFDTLKILTEYVPSTWDTSLLLLLLLLYCDSVRGCAGVWYHMVR